MLVVGCGGDSKPSPGVESSAPFADSFTRRLVSGSWQAIEGDVSPALRLQLRDFQATIRRDGVRRVRGPGALHHDCPENAVVDAGRDCFVYRLEGRQVIILAGVRRIRARFRLWVAAEDEAWEVVNYDYSLLPQMR